MGAYRGARVAADLRSAFTTRESPTMKRCGEKRVPPSVMPPNKRLKLAAAGLILSEFEKTGGTNATLDSTIGLDSLGTRF